MKSSLGVLTRAQPIPGTGFFCECQSDSCLRRLDISLQRYRELSRRGSLILLEHVRAGATIALQENGWALVEWKREREK